MAWWGRGGGAEGWESKPLSDDFLGSKGGAKISDVKYYTKYVKPHLSTNSKIGVALAYL